MTLSNNCGASFRNASLQLVAGDVRRVQAGREEDMGWTDWRWQRSLPGPQFQEEQFFDYHLYTLQRPTDVLDRETKQVSLLEAAGVKAVKKYYYDGVRASGGGETRTGARASSTTQATTEGYVTIEFKNSEAAGLGCLCRRHRAGVQEGLAGETAVRGRGHDRSHAQGRGAEALRG